MFQSELDRIFDFTDCYKRPCYLFSLSTLGTYNEEYSSYRQERILILSLKLFSKYRANFNFLVNA